MSFKLIAFLFFQNWQSTLMLHAFQEQLILSQGSIPSNKSDANFNLGLITSKMSAIVDLEQHTSGFHEPFYVLIAEKTPAAVMMHMWRLDISSQTDGNEGNDKMNFSNVHAVYYLERLWLGCIS